MHASLGGDGSLECPGERVGGVFGGVRLLRAFADDRTGSEADLILGIAATTSFLVSGCCLSWSADDDGSMVAARAGLGWRSISGSGDIRKGGWDSKDE